MLIPGQVQRLSSLMGTDALPHFDHAIVLPFISGKGGTGKTVLCLNTAITLAATGKKVLLADLDFRFPNVHLLANVLPTSGIATVLQGEENAVMSAFRKNLDLLCGEPGYTPGEGNILKVLRYLAAGEKKYDYILADCSAGYDEGFLPLFGAAAQLIFVLTTDPTSVMDAYTMLKILRGKEITTPVSALINKAVNEMQGKTAFANLNKAARHFLGEEFLLAGYIEDSRVIIDSVQTQEPFMDRGENLLLTQRMAQITESVFKITRS